MLGNIFSRRHMKYFSYFSQKTGFDNSCNLSPTETICMKYQILLSGKKKKYIYIYIIYIHIYIYIINLSSAKLAQKVVKVHMYIQRIYNTYMLDPLNNTDREGGVSSDLACLPQHYNTTDGGKRALQTVDPDKMACTDKFHQDLLCLPNTFFSPKLLKENFYDFLFVVCMPMPTLKGV